jgi:hypothetical protein
VRKYAPGFIVLAPSAETFQLYGEYRMPPSDISILAAVA